jgi:hypothetical protein
VLIIVDDEYALPAPEPSRFTTFQYVRSLCVPTVIMHGGTGKCYSRRDGKPWKHPGYRVIRDHKTPERVDREPATAPEDSMIYKD